MKREPRSVQARSFWNDKKGKSRCETIREASAVMGTITRRDTLVPNRAIELNFWSLTANENTRVNGYSELTLNFSWGVPDGYHLRTMEANPPQPLRKREIEAWPKTKTQWQHNIIAQCATRNLIRTTMITVHYSSFVLYEFHF